MKNTAPHPGWASLLRLPHTPTESERFRHTLLVPSVDEDEAILPGQSTNG